MNRKYSKWRMNRIWRWRDDSCFSVCCAVRDCKKKKRERKITLHDVCRNNFIFGIKKMKNKNKDLVLTHNIFFFFSISWPKLYNSVKLNFTLSTSFSFLAILIDYYYYYYWCCRFAGNFFKRKCKWKKKNHWKQQRNVSFVHETVGDCWVVNGQKGIRL